MCWSEASLCFGLPGADASVTRAGSRTVLGGLRFLTGLPTFTGVRLGVDVDAGLKSSCPGMNS